MSSALVGMSAGLVVEGYAPESDVAALRRDHLLREEGFPATGSRAMRGNVVLHVVTDELPGTVPVSTELLLAADLAQWRGAREDARAVELLRAAADRNVAGPWGDPV
ncbi:hypothetical protein AB2L27_11935 [Kineococcus sp. LSe6-4]|uniref:Uncharacterized protein n=1 Tax=Kineococcus halophytocola TaxID=3234027 RepID=A0ABV4H441_9ACTN